MNKLSQHSCDHYRSWVRDDPQFVPYFRQATPEQELAKTAAGITAGAAAIRWRHRKPSRHTVDIRLVTESADAPGMARRRRSTPKGNG